MKKWLIALCFMGIVSACSMPTEEPKPTEEPNVTVDSNEEEAKSEEEVESEEEAKSEEEVESEEEVKPEEETESKEAEPKEEPQPEVAPQPTPEPTPEPQPEPTPEPQPEPTPEPEVKPQPEVAPTPQPEPTPEPEDDTIPTVHPDPDYVAPVITSRYYNSDLTEEENVSLALQNAGVSGNVTVVKALEDPNIVVVVKALSPLGKVSIHDLNQDRYVEAGYDIALYTDMQKDPAIPNTATPKLNTNDAIAFLCYEPDTMPWHYITWSSAVTTAYGTASGEYLIQMDGKGD